jgi:hypothetical protein
VSTGRDRQRIGRQASDDWWAARRALLLRAADPPMAALVDAHPDLDPER